MTSFNIYYFLEHPVSKYSQIRNQRFNIWFWRVTIQSLTGIYISWGNSLVWPFRWDVQLDACRHLIIDFKPLSFVSFCFNRRQLWLSVLTEDVRFGRDSPFQFIVLPDLTIASEKVTRMNDVPSAKPLTPFACSQKPALEHYDRMLFFSL